MSLEDFNTIIQFACIETKNPKGFPETLGTPLPTPLDNKQHLKKQQKLFVQGYNLKVHNVIKYSENIMPL